MVSAGGRAASVPHHTLSIGEIVRDENRPIVSLVIGPGPNPREGEVEIMIPGDVRPATDNPEYDQTGNVPCVIVGARRESAAGSESHLRFIIVFRRNPQYGGVP